jgi:N-acetylmuramoyl-L-alanine amidase
MIALLLALTIAFPRAGQRLPYVERCYMIGAVEPGPTGIVVRGESVAVYRTGAWATMVDVVAGTNVVDVAGSNHWFVVAAKPVPRTAAKAPAPAKAKYGKLPYAGDVAKAVPTNRAPGEITVVIDAGHGGRDAGALSPHGIEEKDANLRMANAVRRELSARGYRVVMTRTGDVAVPLYDRPKVAHECNTDAFISIHHNAPPIDRDPRVLRYSVVYAWNGIGERLATAVNRRMAAELGGEGLKNNGVPHANYAVTRNPEIPSCLIEVDFITSPEGEETSWNPARRRRVAAAIADGFADWAAGK